MDPEALAELGIKVHIIKGYGDTAVAEHAIALMWAAAEGLARMDRGMRDGRWLRTEGMQLTGKTLGLLGFGGIAAEVARLAHGTGMRVLAWNRTPKTAPGRAFVALDTLLAESHVVSLHLLLTDETRGFLSARTASPRMRPGAILVNTARGALVDEAAMIEALRERPAAPRRRSTCSTTEPLPAGHVLTTLHNVTLSAHSAFRTPEASDNLIAGRWTLPPNWRLESGDRGWPGPGRPRYLGVVRPPGGTVDATDLKSGAERRGGSNPPAGTTSSASPTPGIGDICRCARPGTARAFRLRRGFGVWDEKQSALFALRRSLHRRGGRRPIALT